MARSTLEVRSDKTPPFSEHFWTSEGQRHVAAVRDPPERGTKVCFDYLGLSEFMSKCCNPFCTFLLRNVLRTTTACTFSILQLLKVVRTWCALYILTWEMCFTPQLRALFGHLNFQKCSACQVFLVFSLAIFLRATTACNFSSLISPRHLPL